ncbi:hypothetical protein [Azospirillum sp. sgz301742]
MDFDRTYTAGEVEDLTDINSETLRVWRRRGYAYAAETGGWARYSFIGVVGIGALLEATTRFRMDVSEAADTFLRGAAGFFIHEAIDAVVSGAKDVWTYRVNYSVDANGGCGFNIGRTDDPASIWSSVSAPRSVVAINLSDIVRQIMARAERLSAEKLSD